MVIPKFGSRRQVISGRAQQTTGGLRKKDLVLSKGGRVVSKKKRVRALGSKNNMRAHLKKFGGAKQISK